MKTITPQYTFKNRVIAIASHPFLDCVDGKRDLVIRRKDAPKYQIVKVYDNHDYELDPIGFAELAFIPCAEISDTEDLHVVTALIATDLDLPEGQSVSIGAPVSRTVGKYQIYEDIIEISLVDIGHLNGAHVISYEDWNHVIKALYESAPLILKKILGDLSNAKN